MEKITFKITFKRAEKYCRQLWEELAKTGELWKCDAVERLHLPEALNDCFACEIAITKKTKKLSEGESDIYSESYRQDCQKYCPIDWGNKKLDPNCTPCESKGSPYRKWVDNIDNTGSIKTRKKLAKVIAELPWTDRRKKPRKEV